MDLPPPPPPKLETPYVIVAQELPGTASEQPPEIYRATGNDAGGAPIPADPSLPTQP